MRINKHDTNGAKPLLSKGELGYDDYPAGGDVGRVYVGTGTENIALAKKLEANIMTKAQFNALAEERKANRAGSGFDEWGKHYSNISTNPNINEGIWTNSTYINKLMIGTINSPTGISKSNEPYSNINGIVHKIYGVNYENTDRINSILLPTAPTLYPYDTVLTAEQIASGVIKHADSSNSGLIVNGKFDTDTSGWNYVYAASDFAADTTIQPAVKISNIYGNTVQTGVKQSSINIIIGKTYNIEFDILSVDSGTTVYINGANIGIKSAGRVTYSWVATNTEVKISITKVGYVTSMIIDNIAVYPADAISRSDLVFLESWHEDISEKNFIYPLGNVQYLGANTDGLTGIANGAFTGFETYSLFGNWQTASALIGKGYVWSSLTEAQKKAFVSNPENNCYLDGDKVIQVRYRVRVVQGWGDDWGFGIDISRVYSAPDYGRMCYKDVNNSIKIKGKLVSSPDLSNGRVAPEYSSSRVTSYNNDGLYISCTLPGVPDTSSAVAYEGKCFALPIALVHR